MDGILLIDKPAGITSAEVVRRLKARVKPSRVGHLGTLDPFATGLLPILVGEATKLAPFLDGGDKEYEGRIQLGTETDTLDPDGQVTRAAPVPALDAEQIAEVAARFSGRIEQTPPVFSAIKRAGVPMYRLARRGKEPAPPPARKVEIRKIELKTADSSSLRFRVACSPGTYIRALARDIGNALGTVAYLAELRRTRSSGFSIEQACSLAETLASLESGGVVDLVGLRRALPGLPEVHVDEAVERRVRNGDSSALVGLVPAGAALFKVIHKGELVAVCKAESLLTGSIVRVFSSAPRAPSASGSSFPSPSGRGLG